MSDCIDFCERGASEAWCQQPPWPTPCDLTLLSTTRIVEGKKTWLFVEYPTCQIIMMWDRWVVCCEGKGVGEWSTKNVKYYCIGKGPLIASSVGSSLCHPTKANFPDFLIPAQVGIF